MSRSKRSLRFFPAFLITFLILHNASSAEYTSDERLLFSFINSERIREKLSPLVWDEDLHRVAVSHSRDMASADKMAHTGSDGSGPSDRIRSAGVYTSKVGENVARDLNVVSAHTMLMQSLDHRENLLNPAFTHAAVGIVRKKEHIYITELFVRKIKDYSLQEARRALLEQVNVYRHSKNLGSLLLSDSLCSTAQSHAEHQEKLGTMSPVLSGGLVLHQQKGAGLVSTYTTDELLTIPPEIHSDIELGYQSLGIGFKRVRNSVCGMGCYLLVLIFS